MGGGPRQCSDSCRVLPVHSTATRTTGSVCEEPGKEGLECPGADAGYRVDCSPDELECTNRRVLSCGVKFTTTSFLVPKDQPVHLLFLRTIFNELRRQCRCPGGTDPDQQTLPREAFHRAFERLFFLLQDPMGFSIKEYDSDGDGWISWTEFFNVYRQRNITIRLSLCERIFLTFDGPESSVSSQIMSLLVLATIVVSSCCFVLSTVEEFQEPGVDGQAPTTAPLFVHIDFVCLMLFCVEYGVRLATCWNVRTELFRKTKLLQLITGFQPICLPGPALRVLHFIITPANLIDLAAILPAVLSLFIKSEGNGFVVLRLIRLTRIFRACKSPALNEPVIIIGRTLQQSTKALYVLAFNLLLGVVISGSLMYLAEGQGRWDMATQTYQRTAGWVWNSTAMKKVEVLESSPFKSIPHTFWWAMVSITTVGYGEKGNHPRTPWGLVVTTLTMVLSLVMLALPVGVIGGTFSRVWSDYDEEKTRENAVLEQELCFLTTSVQRLEPDKMCRMMLIEVWDDHSDFGEEAKGRAAPFRFMGEAKLQLHLPCDARVSEQRTILLQPNAELVDRKVSGEITLRYEWTPAGLEDAAMKHNDSNEKVDLKTVCIVGPDKIPQPKLQGSLQVTMVSADRLINLGNVTKDGAPNPYCIVFAYPLRPAEGSLLQPCAWRTPTAFRTLSPKWQVSHIFEYDWQARKVDSSNSSSEALQLSHQAGLDQENSLDLKKMSEVVLLIQMLVHDLKQVKEEIRILAKRLECLSSEPPDSTTPWNPMGYPKPAGV